MDGPDAPGKLLCPAVAKVVACYGRQHGVFEFQVFYRGSESFWLSVIGRIRGSAFHGAERASASAYGAKYNKSCDTVAKADPGIGTSGALADRVETKITESVRRLFNDTAAWHPLLEPVRKWFRNHVP